ncbi:dockerin type I domain-containing protein [bacterium]|nr:dockerin type I domain-containing protein [bacterium]
MLGGYADGSACKDSNWAWITGEPFDLYLWIPPGNNYCNYEFHLAFDGLDNGPGEFPGLWNNVTNSSSCCCCRSAALFEWSADCNGDGIVDYGQILDGTFEDADDNGVPDCCDAGTPCVDGAVQWRVEDGGNGHWYQLEPTKRGLYEARDFALSSGGDLVSISGRSENDFLVDLAPEDPKDGVEDFVAWIGLVRDCGVGCDWYWTDEPTQPPTWTNWAPGEPNSSFENGGQIYRSPHPLEGQWNNGRVTDLWPSFIEWSADCNGDGIVDYGQILDGTYPDEDGNGVPDCCDADEACDPCIGDLNGDGVVGPPDLGILLAVWGTDGGDIVAADINGDGTVNASDLGPLLGAWGVCP